MRKELLSDDVRLLVRQGNNFDFLRYFFAISTLIRHFFELSGNEIRWVISAGIGIKVFFILSGFLVFYSYAKNPLIKEFAEKRLRRILPPYILVILFCVLIGALLTSYPILEYVTSIDLYKYLGANLTFLNFLHPTLPGVFENNPIQVMNGSLWTLKVEIAFYLSVPIVFYLLKRYIRSRVLILTVIIILSILYEQYFLYLFNETDGGFYFLLRKQFPGQMSYFYMGILILLYLDVFQKYVKYIFPIALIAFIFRNEYFALYAIQPITFSILVIGFAYNFRYLNFLRKYDNVSYGIYLFHFPVIQVVVNCGLTEKSLFLSFVISLSITILLAILSWKFVEKPFIQKSGKINFKS